MTQLKFKRVSDNNYEYKEAFAEIPNLTHCILDKRLEKLNQEGIFVFPELLKEAEDITKEQIILQSVDGKYRTSNVMGFLGRGNERLVIGSRFGDNSNDYFFHYMLEKVFDIPNIVSLETDAEKKEVVFNLLVFIFPYYLQAALRKGLFKTYVTNKYNDENVKGYIDVARHIKLNTPFLGKIAYNQREYSYDNDLMELVRHTIEFISSQVYGKNLLSRLKDEVKSIVSVTGGYRLRDRQKVIIANIKNTVRHAYFHEYRQLQQLCLMILTHQKHNLGSGSQKIEGVLFDGSWMWEEYLNKIIYENKLIGEDFYHPRNKKGEGRQYLFEGNKGLIYPDFIWRKENKIIIADAKYKPIDNIGGKDYLQVLAYMFRFDAKKGYYLYPESEDKEFEKFILNSGMPNEKVISKRNTEISVVKLGLKIPSGVGGYKKFVENIKKEEEWLMNKILND